MISELKGFSSSQKIPSGANTLCSKLQASPSGAKPLCSKLQALPSGANTLCSKIQSSPSGANTLCSKIQSSPSGAKPLCSKLQASPLCSKLQASPLCSVKIQALINEPEGVYEIGSSSVIGQIAEFTVKVIDIPRPSIGDFFVIGDRKRYRVFELPVIYSSNLIYKIKAVLEAK